MSEDSALDFFFFFVVNHTIVCCFLKDNVKDREGPEMPLELVLQSVFLILAADSAFWAFPPTPLHPAGTTAP